MIGSIASDITNNQEDIVCRFYNESFAIPFKYGFVNIPANGIDLLLCYTLTDYDTVPDSTTFIIGDPTVPLIKNAQIIIQTKTPLHAWLCERNVKNEFTGTSYKLDSVKLGSQAIIKKFGWYSIEIDTVAPKLVQVTEEKDPIIKGQKNLLLKVTDDFSGVKKANVYINNVFVPCEFDLKRSSLIINWKNYKVGDRLQLKLVDYEGNEALVDVN